MSEKKETYLGDGLYASHDGYQFILRAPRGCGEDYTALDPDVLHAFFKFIEKINNVKIEVNANE